MKKIIKIFMLLAITVAVIAMERHPVIVFNGSSCAGKSSVARHLQEKLVTNSTVVSYDDFRRNFFTQHHSFLQLLPADYKYTEVTVFFDDVKRHLSALDAQQKTIKEELVGNFYKKANNEFYKHIREISQTRRVIVDTLFLSQKQKDVITKQLNHNVTTVFVHVPFAAIVERIVKRNAVSTSEARYVNRVLSIYPNFYTINKDGNGCFNGHISKHEIESTVEQSLSLPHSAQFPMGKILSKEIIEKFGLQDNADQQMAQLAPQLSYDYIVDTSVATPEECALYLYNQLKN